MLDNGWIKLHRKLLCNPIVCKDAEHLAVWVYLLLQATHEDRQALFNGEKITLSAGQLLTTYQTIADDLKITKLKVQRIINDMRNDTQIDTRTDRQRSLITISNWGLYQNTFDTPNDTPNDTRMIHETRKKENKEKKKQKEKIKENKEFNKNKRNISPYPLNQGELERLFDLFWQAYPKKVGKAYAYKCFCKINPTQELVDRMLKAIEEQKETKRWDNREYIPNPATWLNQGRWDDEVKPGDKKRKATYGNAEECFEMAWQRTLREYEEQEE